MPSKPGAFEDWPATLPVSYGPFRAVVDRCHDGDTALFFFDLGCDTYVPIWVRIFGINAPESWQAGGDEATQYLEQLLSRDTPVVVRAHGWSFNRLVGSILLEDGTDVATEMVRAGHAVWREY